MYVGMKQKKRRKKRRMRIINQRDSGKKNVSITEIQLSQENQRKSPKTDQRLLARMFFFF